MEIGNKSTERRTVLRTFGVSIAGVTIIAGCLGTDDGDEVDDDADDDADDEVDDDAGDEADDADDEVDDDADDEADDDADDEVDDADGDLEDIENWLNEEPTRVDVLAEEGEVEWGDGVWDGDMVDRTDQDAVDINFSAMLEVDGQPLGPFAVDPIAVEISQGTTVTWEWQGEHGLTSYFDQPHESPEDGAADEFLVEGEEEGQQSHEHVFEEPGVYLYYCFPHGTPYETDFGPAGTDGAQNWFGHRGAIRVVQD